MYRKDYLLHIDLPFFLKKVQWASKQWDRGIYIYLVNQLIKEEIYSLVPNSINCKRRVSAYYSNGLTKTVLNITNTEYS